MSWFSGPTHSLRENATQADFHQSGRSATIFSSILPERGECRGGHGVCARFGGSVAGRGGLPANRASGRASPAARTAWRFCARSTSLGHRSRSPTSTTSFAGGFRRGRGLRPRPLRSARCRAAESRSMWRGLRAARTSNRPPAASATSSSPRSPPRSGRPGSPLATPPTTRPRRCCTGSFAGRGFRGCGDRFGEPRRMGGGGVHTSDGFTPHGPRFAHRRPPPPHRHPRRGARIPRRARPDRFARTPPTPTAVHPQPHPARTASAAPHVQPGRGRGPRAPSRSTPNDAHEVIEAVAAETLAKAERPVPATRHPRRRPRSARRPR